LENQRRLKTILGVLAPSVLLLITDFAIGDYGLFKLINQDIANPVLDFACTYVSPVLFSVFYVLTLVALFFSLNSMSKATGIVSIANGALSYTIGSLIKLLVQRPRPELLAAARVISEARVIGFWHTTAFSFPSTTMMLAFGLSLPVLLEKRRVGTILAVFSYFIGFAVVYTGFHFPLDVAAGAFFSAFITFLTDSIKQPVTSFLDRRKRAN